MYENVFFYVSAKFVTVPCCLGQRLISVDHVQNIFLCIIFFLACCLVATSPMSQVTLKAVDVMLNSSVWSFSSSEVFGCSFVSFNGTMLPVRSLKYLFEGKKNNI